MRRRHFLTASATMLAMPSLARSNGRSVLKYVPGGDLPSLDPMIVPSYETRSHGFMIFDTLYGQAGANQGFAAKPQMVAGHTIENGGKTWKLTLRDGLTFHDGTKVLARDVVASLHRWGVVDAFGQALFEATDELTSPSDKLVQFRLKRPFPLLPQALAKPTNPMAVVMPERLAQTPPRTFLTEMVGSGPYRFLA